MAKAPTTKNEVTTLSKNTGVATYDPDYEDGPSGLQNVQAKDLLIPRLSIIQALSPQLIKSKPEYIESAQVGDFLDAGMGEVFRDVLHIVPVYFSTQYLEWAPRSTGKGLVFNHGLDATIMKKTTKDENGRQVLSNGNYIAETATYYVVNLSANGRKSFLPLASTQLGSSRRWLTAVNAERVERPDGSLFEPPLWYRSWFAKSVETSNAKGTWNTWKFEPGPTVVEIDPTKKLLADVKAFCAMASAGEVQGDVSSLGEESTAPNQEAM